MKIVIDTHTHTVSSGHAYSTVQEIAREAVNNGVEMFAITDHGPAMKGAPYLYHFGNLKVIPPVLYGVRILKGVEANILDYNGSIDMPGEYLSRLDFVLASFHDICIAPGDEAQHTQAAIEVLKNPYVDAIAHPGNAQFQVDIDKVVRAAAEYGKMLEINNHSFYIRAGSEHNCRIFAQKCKEYGVRVVCGSDSHISFDVGKFDKVTQLLEEVGMPEKLVLNTSVDRFDAYLRERKKRLEHSM